MNEDKEYEVKMLYISKMYKEIKEEIETNTRPVLKDYVLDHGVEFVEYIDQLVSLLPVEYERIIRNDYLNKRNVKWWQEYFKKSTYYRRKRKAVRAFVDCVSQ